MILDYKKELTIPYHYLSPITAVHVAERNSVDTRVEVKNESRIEKAVAAAPAIPQQPVELSTNQGKQIKFHSKKYRFSTRICGDKCTKNKIRF